MAKFIKSIFHPTERRKQSRYDDQEDATNFTPPLDGRRKLSISRSGRMKQANKKRHSLSLELYGQEMETFEKSKSIEYNVKKKDHKKEMNNEDTIKRRHSTEVQTPEETIDNAFQIIENT